jgi:small-conductance mechanosensitive channel
MHSLFETPFFGNPSAAWMLAGVIVIAITGGVAAVRSFLITKLRTLEDAARLEWQTSLRELAKRTTLIFAFMVGMYAASKLLQLPGPIHQGIASLFVIALFFQCALWADQLLTVFAEWQLDRRQGGGSTARNARAVVQFLVRVSVWSVALLLILANLGFDVTALVAGLGIGGIAIALAAQSVLADLFASIAIVLDRPFEIGDFIVFDNQMGRVERIGIKTTRLRSLSGEQITCANTVLLASRIHNFRRMSERRATFTIGIAYDTPYDKVARVPAVLRDIITKQKAARFARAYFQAYGQNSLVFEVVYWVIRPDYATYADVQQAINLAMLKRFEEEGIAFAHPDRVPTVRPPRHVEADLPDRSRGGQKRTPVN